MKQNTFGHLIVLFTVILWGNTFVSTKVLLRSFSPVEILFFRFAIGFIALFLAYPRLFKLKEAKHELYFAAAGLCGVTIYFLFENIALTYSFASNVGVLVAVTPLFTGVLACIFLDEKLNLRFFIGFAVAISGIALISFNGATVLKLNPLGDILAIFAAFMWAVYSVIVKKISVFGYNSVQVTRRIFLYGIVLMLPAIYISGFTFDFARFTQPLNLFNMLFLGLGASALCFATWNISVRLLGASTASAYIYLIPVTTVITASIILREQITTMAAAGTALTLLGLLISEGRLAKLFRPSVKNT